ncbi:MAG TPA: SsrA-binding protein SmpB [Pseudomonadota bacterium]|jgi:SsrA-binding protein|nr:SsrA-binding protein SmpB [Pseudomonadota bacterium]HNF96948.1 SsrA-binding protein SmpB [Pseudomonadota bacterium]HNI58301.1 SsrA-binding protein SmpB [Pseudomonadota bacterium]HNK43905.1 SsrA-binding protein SmpB [Pseudomonadota bacterium]HNN50726.1 SsrA-binding protein SmpB [Pseudomonadota bacterium]
MSSPKGDGRKVLLRNSRARHDYFIEETMEAGLVLVGSEVKSLRAGKASLTEAYAQAKNGEAFLFDMQVSEWSFANRFNHEPRRERKLLLHKAEIKKLDEATSQKGYSLLPLEVYLKDGKIKVLIGLGKGKKQFDKREDQKEKDAKLDMKRAMGR